MKKIYLDQNKYIELSRLYHGLQHDEEGILDFLQTLLEKEKAIFPLSFVHFMETSKHTNPARRKRLAETMWNFSTGLILTNRKQILDYEIGKAIEVTFDCEPKQKEQQFFTRNPIQASMPLDQAHIILNTSSKVIVGLSKKLSKKEGWIKYLSSEYESYRKLAIANMSENIDNITSKINSNRKKLDSENFENFKQINWALLVLDTQKDIIPRLINYKISKDEFLELEEMGVKKFYSHIPAFHIEFELKMKAYKNKQKKTDANDFIDAGFLSSALVYFDLIVIEKFWADIIKRTKLNEKYNTVVKTKITDLKETKIF